MTPEERKDYRTIAMTQLASKPHLFDKRCEWAVRRGRHEGRCCHAFTHAVVVPDARWLIRDFVCTNHARSLTAHSYVVVDLIPSQVELTIRAAQAERAILAAPL